MTKANDFNFNTDFLSLAQTGVSNFTVVFPAEHINPGYPEYRTRDVTLPATQGAIDRILISHNGGEYVVASFYRLAPTTPGGVVEGHVSFYRTSPTNMRVRLYIHTSYTYGYDMPTHTFNVRVVSFKPPNVF